MAALVVAVVIYSKNRVAMLNIIQRDNKLNKQMTVTLHLIWLRLND